MNNMKKDFKFELKERIKSGLIVGTVSTLTTVGVLGTIGTGIALSEKIYANPEVQQEQQIGEETKENALEAQKKSVVERQAEEQAREKLHAIPDATINKLDTLEKNEMVFLFDNRMKAFRLNEDKVADLSKVLGTLKEVKDKNSLTTIKNYVVFNSKIYEIDDDNLISFVQLVKANSSELKSSAGNEIVQGETKEQTTNFTPEDTERIAKAEKQKADRKVYEEALRKELEAEAEESRKMAMVTIGGLVLILGALYSIMKSKKKAHEEPKKEK